MTRKYPLRGYFLGVLTHTTAWDRIWGGDVFLRLYIRSLASPRIITVWLGFWNSDHVVLKLSIRSLASPRSVVVWLGFWNFEHVVLKSRIRSSVSPHSVAVWLAFWNSDHVVLKLSIRTSASPRWQQFDRGLRVTQNAYFLLMTYTKQLLLMAFC